VVAVRAARLGREARDDDVGPERADDPHDVGEHLLVVPFREGLAVVLGIPEVPRAAEELAAAVDPAGREELLRPDDPEEVAELGPEEVLAAVAARQRQVGGPVAAPAREVGDQLVFSSSGWAAM
jgi:hypothetical protein